MAAPALPVNPAGINGNTGGQAYLGRENQDQTRMCREVAVPGPGQPSLLVLQGGGRLGVRMTLYSVVQVV